MYHNFDLNLKSIGLKSIGLKSNFKIIAQNNRNRAQHEKVLENNVEHPWPLKDSRVYLILPSNKIAGCAGKLVSAF